MHHTEFFYTACPTTYLRCLKSQVGSTSPVAESAYLFDRPAFEFRQPTASRACKRGTVKDGTRPRTWRAGPEAVDAGLPAERQWCILERCALRKIQAACVIFAPRFSRQHAAVARTSSSHQFGAPEQGGFVFSRHQTMHAGGRPAFGGRAYAKHTTLTRNQVQGRARAGPACRRRRHCGREQGAAGVRAPSGRIPLAAAHVFRPLFRERLSFLVEIEPGNRGLQATRSGAARPTFAASGTQLSSRAEARREGRTPIFGVVLHRVRRHVYLVPDFAEGRAALWRLHALARLRWLHKQHARQHPKGSAEPAPGPSSPPRPQRRCPLRRRRHGGPGPWPLRRCGRAARGVALRPPLCAATGSARGSGGFSMDARVLVDAPASATRDLRLRSSPVHWISVARHCKFVTIIALPVVRLRLYVASTAARAAVPGPHVGRAAAHPRTDGAAAAGHRGCGGRRRTGRLEHGRRHPCIPQAAAR